MRALALLSLVVVLLCVGLWFLIGLLIRPVPVAVPVSDPVVSGSKLTQEPKAIKIEAVEPKSSGIMVWCSKAIKIEAPEPKSQPGIMVWCYIPCSAVGTCD